MSTIKNSFCIGHRTYNMNELRHDDEIKDANDIIQCNWDEVRLKLRYRWIELTEQDIEWMKGTTAELCALLQYRYGYTKERAEIEINRFTKSYGWEKQC